MGSIYLVTDGSYSDYGVYAAFSTREQAEAYRDARGFTNEIEEIPLDVPAERLPSCPPGMHAWRVLWSDGYGWIADRRDDTQQLSESWYRLGRCRIFCYAEDEQHALKIGSEKRAQWLAQLPPGYKDPDDDWCKLRDFSRRSLGAVIEITKADMLGTG